MPPPADPERRKIWLQKQRLAQSGEKGPKRNLTGVKFNRLTVIGLIGRRNVGKTTEYIWKCLCVCGAETNVGISNLVSGNTQSCGCLRLDNFRKPKTAIIRQKMSYTASQNILLSRGNSYKNRLTRKIIVNSAKAGQIYCQSSWEVNYVNFLDSNPEVITFKKDEIRIPYKYQGRMKVYVVDFLITHIAGKQSLVEVKPKSKLTKEGNFEKAEAARIWCKERNIDFVIITEDELKLIKENKECQLQ